MPQAGAGLEVEGCHCLPDAPPPIWGPGEAGQEEMMGESGTKGRDYIH